MVVYERLCVYFVFLVCVCGGCVYFVLLGMVSIDV